MASSSSLVLLCDFLLFSSLLFLANAQPSSRPRGLVLSVTKDVSLRQYLAIVHQGAKVSKNTVLDLGGQGLWLECEEFYDSTTYFPARCGSAQCNLAGSRTCATCYSSPRPGCNNNTCRLVVRNTVTHIETYMGDLGQDVLSIPSLSEGKSLGPSATIPRFIFTCAATFLLEGLVGGTRGMAGLGRGGIGLPSQLAAAFSFDRKFAICLPSSDLAKGAIFFGNGPYVMLPDVDVSASLTYTPLLINPVSTGSNYFPGERSTEYFIGVKSIKVNGKAIPLNTSLLSIQSNGFGGTKISTVNPFTVLQTSIYKALTEAFVREAKLTRVAAEAPLQECFSLKGVASTRVGPGVPSFDLVLQSESIYWRIFGANSMVQVGDSVMCLGFVDGGSNPRTSIVLGAHQLEDNLLQFDLAASRLGFSSSLLFRQTTCSNFNFTSNA